MWNRPQNKSSHLRRRWQSAWGFQVWGSALVGCECHPGRLLLDSEGLDYRMRTVFVFVMFSVWITSVVAASEFSPLGTAPDWSRLDPYQSTISKTTFKDLLDKVYSIDGAHKLTIKVGKDHAMIETGTDKPYRLQFVAAGASSKKTVARFWRPASSLAPAPPRRCLLGLHVALDPGHLGGQWAKMEERWYQMGTGGSVKEGEMTLRAAKLLKTKLERAGAMVSMVRDYMQPTTNMRPANFEALARADLKRMGVVDPEEAYVFEDPPEKRRRSLQWHQEKYFYRASEIRARAKRVNDKIKPDLVLCLHFNAEAWGNPSEPDFVPRNHLHILVNGAYSLTELGRHDERFLMLLKLLQRCHSEEAAAANAIAKAIARHTQLPAFNYITNNVKRFSPNPYLYARNLMANRLFECPVVYLEPYVMNCQEVYDRVQAGPYQGTKRMGDREVVNLYEEYAQSVFEGMLAYYQDVRPKS